MNQEKTKEMLESGKDFWSDADMRIVDIRLYVDKFLYKEFTTTGRSMHWDVHQEWLKNPRIDHMEANGYHFIESTSEGVTTLAKAGWIGQSLEDHLCEKCERPKDFCCCQCEDCYNHVNECMC